MGTPGSVLIFAIYRLVTALPVLRWQLAGAFIAIIGDLCDLVLLYYIGSSWNYQALDKYFDLFYMTTFLIAALKWKGVERNIAVALFAFRLVGFVGFEVTDQRPMLILFPNVFEFWFVAVAYKHHFLPRYTFTWRRIAVWLAAATVLKLGQEYLLHVWRWLDTVTLSEFLRDIWRWLTPFA